MDEEILDQSLKTLYNKVSKLYDFHRTRVNINTLELEIKRELKTKIKRKIENDIMKQMRNVYNSILAYNKALVNNSANIPRDVGTLKNALLGTNELINQGAKMVTCVEDIIEEYL